MTVSTTNSKIVYNGDGVTTAWSYSFPVIQASDIQVFITDTLGNVNQIGSGFSVDIANSRVNYPTTGSPLAAGTKITLVRTVTMDQLTDWRNQGPFNSEVLEANLDKLTMEIQQLNESLARCIKYGVDQTPSDTTTASYLASIAAASAVAQTVLGLSTYAYLAPTPNTPNDTKVAVAAGKFMKSDGSGIVTYVGGQSPAFSVVSANSRIDLLCIDDTGTLSIIQGTQAASPVPPTYPVLKQAIAEVTITETSGVQISSADIKDARGFLLNPNGNYVKMNDGTYLGFRNRLINGDMRIDQRNAGASKSIASASVLYTLDRWGAAGDPADGVFSVQRLSATPPTGFTHYMRATTTTADGALGAAQNYSLRQYIEGGSVRDFLLGSASAKTFTLSFWVRSSLTGTFSGSFQNGAVNRAYPFTFVINSANTWEYKTVSVAGDTTGAWLTTIGIGLSLSFDLGSGANYRGAAGAWAASSLFGVTGAVSPISTLNATLDLTGLQIEVGSQATSFEYRPEAVELALCQRYYEKSYDLGDVPGTNTATNVNAASAAQTNTTTMRSQQIGFKVQKRAVPTTVLYTQAGVLGSWTWTSSTNVDTDRVTTATPGAQSFYLIQTVAVNSWAYGHWTADAEL